MKTLKDMLNYSLISLTILVFCLPIFSIDPGDECDPDECIGYSATLVSYDGNIVILDDNNNAIEKRENMTIPSGAMISSEEDSFAYFYLEDGTSERKSYLRLLSNSSMKIMGGIFCSDLRPKADAGRWHVREIEIELKNGEMEVEIADGVSHNLRLEINTPNSFIFMERRTRDKMNVYVTASVCEDTGTTPLLEHPDIQQTFELYAFGKSYEELSSREKEAVRMQAAIAAFSRGLIDIEESGLLDNPQISSNLQMMTQGRPLNELDGEELDMAMNMVVGLALQMDLIDLDTLEVSNPPNEETQIKVNHGNMQVRNKYRPFTREEAKTVEQGMTALVINRKTPEVRESGK